MSSLHQPKGGELGEGQRQGLDWTPGASRVSRGARGVRVGLLSGWVTDGGMQGPWSKSLLFLTLQEGGVV